ncbi:MAG TPA: RNA methyltransferase [Microbacteriaceae bacterium]|nr:RNA methyltransferase [Microbacteriaceae bacterium]
MRVQRVGGVDDAALADYTGLTDVALRRTLEPAGGLYIAESTKVLARALEAGHRPRSVLVQEKWLPDVTDLLAGFPRTANVPVYVGGDELLSEVTGFHVHRGALASMHRPPLPEARSLLRAARLVVIVEDVVDHTNVGAIFRSAAGLGADAVLVTPRCADPLYRRSVRVSMGTVFQVPWTRLPDWPEGADLVHEAGFHIAALALRDDAVGLDEFCRHAPKKVAVLVGTEGDGLSRQAVHDADSVVRIPMLHGVDSLNVAASSAVALWALRRRR